MSLHMSFKPYYKWITFNTIRILDEAVAYIIKF